MGLDWEGPPYPPESDRKAAPVELRIVGAELVDPKKMAEYQGQKAVADLYFNPFDADAHYRLGSHLLAAGDAERARAHLGTALAFRPALHAARAQRARAAYRLRRWDEAITDASAYLKHDPEDGNVLFIRANACRMAERYQDAIRDYTALATKYPRDPRMYECRAACHQAVGKEDEARADRAAASRIDPTYPTARNNLAWRLLTGPAAQRDAARALTLIQQAVQQQPQNAAFFTTLGVAQYRRGMYKEARFTLETSLASGRNRHDAIDLYFLAMCDASLGARTRAQVCFDEAVLRAREQKGLSEQLLAELKQFRAEAEAVLAGQ
jgi:Flp pilus assembly protein TadD